MILKYARGTGDFESHCCVGRNPHLVGRPGQQGLCPEAGRDMYGVNFLVACFRDVTGFEGREGEVVDVEIRCTEIT